MNQPKQPEDPPKGGASPESNPGGQTPNGIPAGGRGNEPMSNEPMGRPTSDRAKTESGPHNA